MAAIRKTLASAFGAALGAWVQVEPIDGVGAKAWLDPGSCAPSEFVGAVEGPNWWVFEPTSLDGVILPRTSMANVSKALVELDYDLDRIRDVGETVPRLLLTALPVDFSSVSPVDVRKEFFILMVLPISLLVNERILAQRRILEILRMCIDRGVPWRPEAAAWVQTVAELYDEDPEIEPLLARVDAIPPSLFLAQAAIESGWGTSRFAHDGNALFGEHTQKADRGLLPSERPVDWGTRVRQFEHVIESVVSYARNLNTHPAYQGFRARRAALRANGQALDGYTLAGELARYSVRRHAYVREVRAIIQANRLSDFDDVELARPNIRSPAAWR